MIAKLFTLNRLNLVAATVLFTLTFGVLGNGRAYAADPIDDAAKTIEKNHKDINSFAYPSLKRSESVVYKNETTNRDGSFTLTYRFNYRDSDNDPAHVTLKFLYNSAGKMTDIVEVDRSSFWESFTTANILLAVVKEGIKNDPKLKDDPNWTALLQVDDAKVFLIGALNLAIGKSP